MIHQTWGTFQLPPTFTQQLVEQIYRVSPTPTPSDRPQLPWITAITLGVAALVVVVGMIATSEFQQPYSLNPSTPIKIIELTQAPIVETPFQKLPLSNHADGDGNPVLALAAGDDDTTQTEKPRGSISGSVIYADSGKPAANVPIRAIALTSQLEKEILGHTGADGTYTLKYARPRWYTVMIGDTRQWHATFDWRAPAHEGINVKPMETYNGVDFLLTPGVFIEGQVTDGDTEESLERMLITVYDATHPPRLNNIGHRLTTDKDGRYRFRVAPGPVRIFIATEDTGYYIIHPEPEHHYSEEIQDNETRSSFDFVCIIGNSIDGIVQTEDFEPVVGATVEPHDDAPFHARMVTDKEVRFTLKGVPRHIKNAVITAKYNDYELYGQGEWSSKQAQPVAIKVVPVSARIGGRVIDRAGKPIAIAGIGLARKTDGGASTLVPFVQSDSQGNFTVGPKTPLNSLKVGKKHRLYATAEGYGMVSSEWFTLQDGWKHIPDLMLPEARFFVAGQVVDWRGQPVGAANVGIRDTQTHTDYAHTLTDADGKFRVENVSDPRVHVFAFAEGYYGSDEGLVYDANREDLRVVLSPDKPMIRDEIGNTISFRSYTFPHPLEGSAAPELKIDRWFNTKPIALSSLHGKVVVLNFWSALWSSRESCAVWFPALNRIHDQYSDKRVIVIGVHTSADLQHHADIQAAIDKEEIRYPIGIATKTKDEQDIFGASFKDYSVKGCGPTILFVDKGSKLRTLFLIGGSIEAKVLALLNE